MNEKIELLKMQEAERKRIAEDLHDTTVQDLVYLSQQLELAVMYLSQDINLAQKEILSAKNNIKKIIDDMRGTIYDLRPMAFDDIGWSAAIEKLKNDFCNKNDINVIFDVCDIDDMNSIFKITIYRIIRELCQNIFKHAQADTMNVCMKKDDSNLFLSIIDNGVGFLDSDISNHFGLSIVKEKVALLSGTFSISTNDKGTEVTINIPIQV